MSMKQHDLIGSTLIGMVTTDQCAGAVASEGFLHLPDAETNHNWKIDRVEIIGDTALTGTASNYASVAIQDGGAAGTGSTAITGGSEDFDSGTDLVVGTPIVLTPTAANELDGGDVLRCRVTKTGTGAFMGKLTWFVYATGT